MFRLADARIPPYTTAWSAAWSPRCKLCIDTVVISGGATDVCVLATVLGAVDWGFRVVVATDAICSSADQTHDALMELYRSRFSEQVEAVTAEEVLAAWR